MPVLSEGRIFTTATACSQNRYPLAAGTDPANKTSDAKSTGSCLQLVHNSPECRLYQWSIRIKHTYAVLNVRREQDIVRPPAPIQITPVTDRYRVLFGNLIPRRRKFGRVPQFPCRPLTCSVNAVLTTDF